MFLSDVCLSVAYIAPNTRKRGLGRLKIGTEVRIVQVTRDSDTTFKVKRSRSPGHAIWLVVLAGQHTYMVTYTYMTYGVRVTTCRPGWGHTWRLCSLLMYKILVENRCRVTGN